MGKIILATFIGLSLSVTSLSFAGHHDHGKKGDHKHPPKFMAAMKACEKENGITFDHKAGKHPTDEQKAVIEKCLVGKGFEKPPGHEHGHDHGHGKGAPPPPKSPEIPPADPAAAK